MLLSTLQNIYKIKVTSTNNINPLLKYNCIDYLNFHFCPCNKYFNNLPLIVIPYFDDLLLTKVHFDFTL